MVQRSTCLQTQSHICRALHRQTITVPRTNAIRTYIVRLQHLHPVPFVFGRLATQIPHAIVDRHIETAFVELVALQHETDNKKHTDEENPQLAERID